MLKRKTKIKTERTSQERCHTEERIGGGGRGGGGGAVGEIEIDGEAWLLYSSHEGMKGERRGRQMRKGRRRR
jgi:hypothetical protein